MISANKENFNINSFPYSVTGEIQNPGYTVLNRDYGNVLYLLFQPSEPIPSSESCKYCESSDGEMVCSRRCEIPVCQEVS